MSLLRFAVAVMAICSVSACQTRVEALSESDRRAVTEAVTARMMSYAEALGALDSGQVMSFYSTDSSVRVVDGQAVFTRDGIGALKGSLKSMGGGFNYDSLRVLALSQTAAVATAPYVDVLVDTTGVTTTVHGSVRMRQRSRRQKLCAHAF